MKAAESLTVNVSLESFLARAASAGVVAGCGAGRVPAFDARRLALRAVTALHGGREAVEAELAEARDALADCGKARAEEAAEALSSPESAGPMEFSVRPSLFERVVAWFRQRARGTAESVAASAVPVTRAELVARVTHLEARVRGLLALEADYAGIFAAEYELHRSRVGQLQLYATKKGGE